MLYIRSPSQIPATSDQVGLLKELWLEYDFFVAMVSSKPSKTQRIFRVHVHSTCQITELCPTLHVQTQRLRQVLRLSADTH